MLLEEVESLLKAGKGAEEALAGTGWKGFEEICSNVLEEHGWVCERNLRIGRKRRTEIDIKAEKAGTTLLIDCKHWGMRKGKSTQLREAVLKQIERAEMYSKGKRYSSENAFPVMITLMDEDILRHENVWVVPFSKLNGFLLDIASYLEGE